MKRLSSLTAEIFRRTTKLFKNVGELERLALIRPESEEENGESKGGIERNKLSHAGAVLRSLNEYTVRNLCGEAVYGAGLQNYTQGRVSDKKFSKDTLSGKLNEGGRKWVSSHDLQLFEPSITLEKKSRLRFYGDCACTLAKEGSLCTHMAALMIAWVRKPEDFQENENKRIEFEQATRRVLHWLDELVSSIEKGSSRTVDLRVLQKTYSKLRLWADEIREANDGRLKIHTVPQNEDRRLLIREFSKTINSVSFAIMSAIESKYRVGATDLYNRTTVSTFAKMVELFAESSSQRKSEKPTVMTAQRKKQRVILASASSRAVSSRPSRSWDVLVESFTSSR
jgi:hypothetical protein